MKDKQVLSGQLSSQETQGSTNIQKGVICGSAQRLLRHLSYSELENTSRITADGTDGRGSKKT